MNITVKYYNKNKNWGQTPTANMTTFLTVRFQTATFLTGVQVLMMQGHFNKVTYLTARLTGTFCYGNVFDDDTIILKVCV